MTTPEIPGLDLPRAKRYGRVRLGLFLAGTGGSLARAAWFAGSGRSAALRRRVGAAVPDPRLETPAYLAASASLSWLAGLPWSFAAGYGVERAFGLTRQQPAAWLADAAKGLGLTLALQTPLLTGAYAVVRRRPHDWWLVLAGATVPLTVTLGALGPVVIAPLFNRFRPLDDPELTARIKALGDQAGVPIAEVFGVDMSRQTEKANAYFTGLGRTKRIVLGDTLLRDFAPEEIEGVVAHELGHQVHGDMWRFVALGGAVGFGGAWAVHRLAPPLVARTRDRTGVAEIGDPAGLPLLALVGAGVALVAGPATAAVSRAIERRTDRYAVELTGDGRAYAAAMRRLAVQNLADPAPPRLAVLLLHGHPPLAERIAAAEAFAARAAVEVPSAG